MALLRKTILSLLSTAAACLVLFMCLTCLFPLPSLKPFSLVVKDRNNEFMHAFLASDGIWRIRTSPAEIPPRFREILLQKEDRFFYYHPGINPLSILRALVQNAIHRERISGASTITMQVARMLEPKERTYFNKCVEMFRALQLEWKFSKDDILQMYLSMIPLGGNIEGLKSASLMYYQTPLERLNIAQLCDLILIPNDPARLRPDKRSNDLYQKRITRARKWLELGFLTAEDSAVMRQTSSHALRRQLPMHARHFSLRIKEFGNGLSEIVSSVDLRIQKVAERLLRNHLRPWKLIGVHNGAVMIIDNTSLEIAAYVGSESFDDSLSFGQVDAVRAVRSPGSTLKPFLFALQMDRGSLTPKTRLLDVPYDTEGYVAENYDGSYSGYVYADEALKRSLNVPMIRLLKETGARAFVGFLSQVGISSLEAQREKIGLSMIVGGCGVTLEELTSAYATFGRGGIYSKPSFVRREEGGTDGAQAISNSAAYMVTEILSDIHRPDLPNNFESAVNLPAVAFKTGTSYGRRDAWCIGYSSEYTVGVWIGNVTNRGAAELVGSKSAAPLLVDIFNAISSTNQKTILPMPGDVRLREVCSVSGLLPTERCTQTISDYFSRSRSLNKSCDVDREYFVSKDGNEMFCTSCLEQNQYEVVTFRDYPAEVLSHLRRSGTDVKAPPQHRKSCERVFGGEGPKIISPTRDMTYFLVSSDQRITLHASSSADVRQQAWYLNNQFLGRRRAGEKVFLNALDGAHTVTCIDDKGRTSSVNIKVKHIL